MKYLLPCLFLFFGGCAIQGEVFRLQQRVKAWNNILPDEQLSLFAQNDTNTLGLWLDSQEAADPGFAQKLKTLRQDEAIMSFDGTQTAHFFYNTLLKDLAKFSYAELIKNLNAEEFQKFLASPDGSSLLGGGNITETLANARASYGMTNFSDADILRYHRQKSLPAHLYIVVYDTLSFAAKQGVFLWKNNPNEDSYEAIAQSLQTMEKNARSRRRQAKRAAQSSLDEWNYILSRAQVPAMPPKTFLKIITEQILPEMDREVQQATMYNLNVRFNIQ